MQAYTNQETRQGTIFAHIVTDVLETSYLNIALSISTNRTN